MNNEKDTALKAQNKVIVWFLPFEDGSDEFHTTLLTVWAPCETH